MEAIERENPVLQGVLPKNYTQRELSSEAIGGLGPEWGDSFHADGVRIGEALAVVWHEVDFNAGTVQITSTLVRIKGEGLLRKQTKSRAWERTLPLPPSA